MQKFLYVFTEDMAELLQQQGFEPHSHNTQGKEYWVFTLGDKMPPPLVFKFSAGNDYVVSDRMFFKEGEGNK